MIYQFECTNEICDHEEEIMMKVADYERKKEKLICSECQSPLTNKVTVPHFSLVGGGWARDQYSNYVRNEQKAAIDEHDNHRHAHDSLMQKEERLGEV